MDTLAIIAGRVVEVGEGGLILLYFIGVAIFVFIVLSAMKKFQDL
jgi:hypothetical protein